MSPSPQREEELFAAALALPAAERPAFLERECAGDAELRRRVEGLLHVHEEARNFLETPAVADLPAVARAGASQPPPEEAAGTMIGRYKLLQKIGEGGCGTVYLAEQEEPVRRRVALKIIRLGMDTREVIARFEAERQALALMDHPNIARVFDAGATDAGRPYFVMELVRGVKITDYCDQHSLPTADRLNLFIQVCHAVQHAHQKGVIHRDLKPSNILVTLQDGAPVPKVIDFGIAKATQGRLTDRTLFTAFEQFIGTPAYMSPEQAELSSQDVDTRSDIYSLGVLLYELLTGRTPFETKELLKAGLDEMRRVVREVEPPKPSTRLGTLADADRTAVAQRRGTVPAQLSTLIRGDLDWIVMRCLEKNRTRRYATANELALDLDRHEHDEPVTARPPSTFYRFQKLVRRNKLVVAATAAIAAALVAGLSLSTWEYMQEKAARQRAVAAEEQQSQLRRQAEAARERAVAAEEQQRQLRQQAETVRLRAVAAEEEQSRQRQQAEDARNNEARQRALAEEARNNEAHQREQAEAARKKAEIEAAKSQQIARFLAEMLNSVDPSVALGRDTKLLRAILDKTAERIGNELRDQPEIEAPLRAVLGHTYLGIGDYEQAEAMFRTAQIKWRTTSSKEDPLMGVILRGLGEVLLRRGAYAEAEALSRESVAVLRQCLGNESAEVAASLTNLSTVLQTRGDLAGAESAAQEALAIQRKVSGSENLGFATGLNNSAVIRVARGDWAGAESLLREALAIHRKLDSDGPQLALVLTNLAYALEQEGDKTVSEGMYREALGIERKVLGNEHVDLATTLNDLATLVADRGDLAMAEIYYREALAIARKQLGREHSNVATILNNLAFILYRRRDYAGAETMFSEALAIQRKALGPENLSLVPLMKNLADTVYCRGDSAKAEAMLRQALAMQRKLAGNEHPLVANLLADVASYSMLRHDWHTAEAELTEALRIAAAVPSVDPLVRSTSAKMLAVVYEGWAKTDPTKAALAALWKTRCNELTLLGKLVRLEPAARLGPLDNLGWTAYGQRRFQDAELFFREESSMARKSRGDESAAVANALNGLGWTLFHEGRYRDAEAAFRERLAVRRKLCRPDDPDLGDALHALGAVLLQTAGPTEAEPLLREALAIARKLPGGKQVAVTEALDDLGEAASRRGDLSKAEALLAEAYENAKGTPAAASDVGSSIVERLAGLYATWAKTDPSKAAQAARWKKKVDELKKAGTENASASDATGDLQWTVQRRDLEAAGEDAGARTAVRPVKYANTKTADSAVLRTFNPPPLLRPVFPPPFVQIIRVDGALIETGLFGIGPTHVYVVPGKRRVQVGVTYSHFIYFTCANETVEFEFQNGENYNLSAKAVGDDFDLMLWDEAQGTDKPILLRTWRLTGNRDLISYRKHLRD